MPTRYTKLIRHITTSRRSKVMLKLRSKWGDRGYGWWWCIKETIMEQEKRKILADELWILKLNTDGSMQAITEFVKDCIEEYKLLKTDGKYIYDPHLPVVYGTQTKKGQYIPKKKPKGFSLLG